MRQFQGAVDVAVRQTEVRRGMKELRLRPASGAIGPAMALRRQWLALRAKNEESVPIARLKAPETAVVLPGAPPRRRPIRPEWQLRVVEAPAMPRGSTRLEPRPRIEFASYSDFPRTPGPVRGPQMLNLKASDKAEIQARDRCHLRRSISAIISGRESEVPRLGGMNDNELCSLEVTAPAPGRAMIVRA